jgi:hypothetical protein
MNTTTESSTSELEENQEKSFEFALNAVKLVNLDKFFIEAFYITNHTAYEYNIDFNFKIKDIQKIFYNAFIFTLCEFIKKSNDKIIFHYKDDKQNKYYSYIAKKCKMFLPICMYIKDLSFEEIIQRYVKKEAEVCGDLEKITSQVVNFKNYRFTFNRLNIFLKKNELSFLKDAYFTQHQIKLILMA